MYGALVLIPTKILPHHVDGNKVYFSKIQDTENWQISQKTLEMIFKPKTLPMNKNENSTG